MCYAYLKAMRAIRKVERALNSSANVRHGTSQHIGNFLKGYMLGIIALLNDILQDVQGRKTDDMKRKVLFGLELLECLAYNRIVV